MRFLLLEDPHLAVALWTPLHGTCGLRSEMAGAGGCAGGICHDDV